MKFFWSFLSRIYSNIYSFGFANYKPSILFNNPNKKLSCEFQSIIFADSTFTNYEQFLILKSLEDLHYFCNGLIKINIEFNLDSKDSETIKNNNVLLRADPSHPSIIKADGYYQTNILGLCEYMANDTIRLYLIPERLTKSLMFKTTATHELGHFLNLNHTERPSIMHKINYGEALYPTKNDAKEMSKHWDTYYRHFRYFKL